MSQCLPVSSLQKQRSSLDPGAFFYMRSSRTLLLAAALAGCSAGTSPSGGGLTEAYATRRCGPADAAGVTIYLSPSQPPPDRPPQGPFVRLTIQHDIGEIGGHTYVWSDPVSMEASAELCGDAGVCTVASSGTISISSVDENRTTAGSYNLRFAGTRLQGVFTAPWRELLIRCG